MSSEKPHYYLLAGDSLKALNRLIEYDRVKTTWQLDAWKQEALKNLPALTREAQTPQVKKTDTAASTSGFCADFTAANIRAYQQKLGFHDLPVQVHNYGDGTIYRAYQALPKIAMNPGTSKMSFGLADFVNNPAQQPKERTAIFITYEDYKGHHFAPPGAKELTAEEFNAYEDAAESFEYYREYNQGVALPADFDPQVHQTVPRFPAADFAESRATHHFILNQDAQKLIAAYDTAHNKWQMDWQNFCRNVIENQILAMMLGDKQRQCWGMVEDTRVSAGLHLLTVYMTEETLEQYRDDIEKWCTIVSAQHDKSRFRVVLAPRSDTSNGLTLAHLLNDTPVEPSPPAVYELLAQNNTTMNDNLRFDDKMLGFPFMQIERPQDPDVRLLAFRLPAHVMTIDPPNDDCTLISADDYIALSAEEPYFAANNPPRHVFRLGGETLKMLQDFENSYADYLAKSAAFRQVVEDIMQRHAPGCVIHKYDLTPYETRGPRNLQLTISRADLALASEELFASFEDTFNAQNLGPRPLRLKIRQGGPLEQAFAEVPYEPLFPLALAETLGFYANKGYALTSINHLRGTKQKVVQHNFPPYVTGVSPPPGTTHLTREEFMHCLADSCDTQGGTEPPPCPAHLQHLHSPEGKSLDHARSMKNRLSDDGLPLGPRSDMSWFKKSRI